MTDTPVIAARDSLCKARNDLEAAGQAYLAAVCHACSTTLPQREVQETVQATARGLFQVLQLAALARG